MENLEILVLPCHEITWGKQVFLGCGNLSQIQISGDESGDPALPWLMASVVRVLKEESLVRPEVAGSSIFHGEWLKKYDKALLRFIASPDEEGFDPVFIGWFDVKDIDDQLPGHLLKRRNEKTELVLQRLIYSSGLTKKSENFLVDYLTEHMPGDRNKEHTAVFDALCDEKREYCRDVRYMRLLEEKGVLTEEIIALLLENMKIPSAEVKAFLLNKKGEFAGKKNVFEDFEL